MTARRSLANVFLSGVTAIFLLIMILNNGQQHLCCDASQRLRDIQGASAKDFFEFNLSQLSSLPLGQTLPIGKRDAPKSAAHYDHSNGDDFRLYFKDKSKMEDLMSLVEERITKLHQIKETTPSPNAPPPPYPKDGKIPSSVKCDRNQKGECIRGTVEVDPWYLKAIEFQQKLQMDRPLNKIQFGGTHNSHIDFSDGYGHIQQTLTVLVQSVDPHQAVQISNQWITVTDQLRLGVRQIELDVHYFEGDLRICHAGGIHLKAVNELVTLLEKLLNTTIHWDSETIGCFGLHYPTFSDSLAEISDWIRKEENQKAFLLIMIDDEMDLEQWKLVGNLSQIVERHLGDLILTPDMKKQYFPGLDWPTPNQMIQLSKRIIISTRQSYKSESLGPYLFLRDDIWEEYSLGDHFEPYPICKPQIHNPNITLLRFNADALWYAWFYQSETLVNHETLTKLTECVNINFPSIDLLTPELATAWIWSWKQGEPKYIPISPHLHPHHQHQQHQQSHPLPQTPQTIQQQLQQQGRTIQQHEQEEKVVQLERFQEQLCILMDVNENGRWEVRDSCKEEFPAACQSNKYENEWIVSSSKVSYANATNSCPSEYHFSIPRNGQMNRSLYSAALNVGAKYVYIMKLLL